MKRIPEVDAYIAAAPEFARPILERIREVFHAGGADVEEAIKWRTPHFVRRGLLGGMAAFKQHVSLGFWRGKELDDPAGLFGGVGDSQMCALKVRSLSELPSKKVLVAYVKAAIALDEAGPRACATDASPGGKASKPASRPVPKAPSDLLAALAKKPRARAAFEAFPPSHKREYVEWITEAKRPETRAKRLAQAVEWMAEGKSRNWKYQPGSKKG